jgi:hypothetical protein
MKEVRAPFSPPTRTPTRGRELLASGYPCDLWRGEVSDDLVLLDLIDYELVRLVCPGDIKLNRLIDRPVFLLNLLIVGEDFDRVLVVLRFGLLQTDRDVSDLLRCLRLAEAEFKVVSLAECLKRCEFLTIGRDESALDAKISSNTLQLCNRLLKL